MCEKREVFLIFLSHMHEENLCQIVYLLNLCENVRRVRCSELCGILLKRKVRKHVNVKEQGIQNCVESMTIILTDC